jgi:hypothetical protein
MAKAKKINWVSTKPKYWKVLITVEDPDLSFSIKPNMSYKKVFGALSANAAVRAAANYCNKYMKYYPGTQFNYSTKDVEPYYYSICNFSEEKDNLPNTFNKN